STARDPDRLDIERIDRLAGGHEQPVALAPAEAEVGAALGQQDAPDQGAIGREHRDAVLAFAAGEARPDIALGVDTDAVGETFAVAGTLGGGGRVTPVVRCA